jgi:predicted RNase H-like nuclease
MAYRKKIEAGVNERLTLLRPVFPAIDHHLRNRPSGVGKDDLLDAAVAAWSALRISNGEAQQVCKAECDSKGLMAGIWYRSQQGTVQAITECGDWRVSRKQEWMSQGLR